MAKKEQEIKAEAEGSKNVDGGSDKMAPYRALAASFRAQDDASQPQVVANAQEEQKVSSANNNTSSQKEGPIDLDQVVASAVATKPWLQELS